MSARPRPAPPPDRLPPHAEDVEKAAIGCLLVDPETARENVAQLRPGDFYTSAHREVFAAIRALLEQHGRVDVITLEQALREAGKLDDVGGRASLAALLDAAPSAAMFATYASQLHEQAARRRLMAHGTEAVRIALDANGGFADRAAEFARAVRIEAVGDNAVAVLPASEIVNLVLDENDNLLGDRLLAREQVLTICGSSGLGKSRLLLQLAACMIVGRPFCGMQTHGGPVTWLAFGTENSKRRLRSDLIALERWLGPEAWREVSSRLHVQVVGNGADGPLTVDNPAAVEQLRRTVERINPDVVSFDSLGNFAAGDPNSDADMRASVNTLARIAMTGRPDRAAVILHHALTGRAGAMRATGYDRASFGRGSKALHAVCRGQINLTATDPDSNEGVLVSCGKNSNGPEFAPFAIRLNPNSMIYEPDPGFDREAWEEAVSGRPSRREPVMTPERVAQLCRVPMSKAELTKAIRDDCGCARQNAYRYLKAATDRGRVRFNERSERYVASN